MPDRLRVGLLQTGHVPAAIAPEHGDYPALFDALLGSLGIDLVPYDLPRGHAPTDLDGDDRHDGWVITGSTNSAYDDEDWIPDLEGLCRTLLDREEPLVGICFGHQVLAQAAGGRVERADVGWGVGVHDYHLVGAAPAWVDADPPDPIRIVASHQDQVVELPDDAEVFLTSEFCPVAGFTMGPRVMTVQAHPEFTTGLSASLLTMRRERLGPELCDSAAATHDGPLHAELVAGWIDRCLRVR